MLINCSYPAKTISYSTLANTHKYIVVHYTANKNDTAKNNARYYNTANTRSAGAHLFVDKDTIYKSVPLKYRAYAVGGTKYNNDGGKMYKKITNANSISIEVAAGTTLEDFNKSFKTLSSLIIWLMKKYNISIDNVYRHYDVNGKPCPLPLVETTAWSEFKNKLSAQYEAGSPYTITEKTCTTTCTTKLRNKAGTVKTSVPSSTCLELVSKDDMKLTIGDKKYKMSKVLYNNKIYYTKSQNLKFN